MKKLILFSMFLAIFIWGGTAWGSFFSESLIYTGPPEYAQVYDDGNRPTYASGSAYGKDAEARADWWELGGRLHNSWNNTYQGWIYVFADFDKDFEVTAAGPASIRFSWEGSMQAIGDSKYNNNYYLYADANVEDGSLMNNDVYWYDELNSAVTLSISESDVFNYVFDAKDVGNFFTISLTLQTEVGLLDDTQPINFTGNDSLDFTSNFYNTLKIDSISGGIEAVQGPPVVPLPSTVLLLGSSLLGLIGIRRKFGK